MNDENFISGGVTNDAPNLIVKLEDANGINTASGIGHDLIAVLDGDQANPFKLNDYYQADVDNYTKGTASFKLRDLEDGLHTLSVKAWDTYNNSSIQEINLSTNKLVWDSSLIIIFSFKGIVLPFMS